MKKYLSIICLTTLLCCGCGKKSLNCTLQLNEDDALTTTNINYTFDLFGKQTTRLETITVTFDDLDECNYYYDYISNLYNNNNDNLPPYSIEKDETTFTVKTYRNITIKNVNKQALKDLEPKTNLNRKKLLKYYKDIGFNCN